MIFIDPQPVAGPSSRPYDGLDDCVLGAQCPFPNQSRGTKRRKRQSPSSASTTASSESSSFASSTSTNFFPTPSAANSSTSTSASLPSSVSVSSSSSGPSSSASSSSSSFSYTGAYTYTPHASPPAATPTFVPGVILNLTLNGDSDSEAIYGVPVAFGHGPAGQQRKRASTSYSGWQLQNMTLQVDLGSSDMWVAAMDCGTTDCNSAPSLFNSTNSTPTGVNATLNYYSGEASGEIYWEEVNLGGFEIGYQAFVAADIVTDEDLSGGEFSGVLGLGMPAASTILSEIPGSTGSSPDGATFLNNLFGLGTSAPTERLFTLSLARREDVRTWSELTFGTIDPRYCAPPCNLTYMPTVAQPQLGATGYTHWRIAMNGISYTTWGNAQQGTGNTTNAITLGPSQVVTSRNTPLSVLDSGGVAILVGYKPYLNSIYGAYGITPSSDGLYRMPCTLQLAFTFHFNGADVPIHPLDMSWPDPADPSQQVCIGAFQYAPTLGDTGDFILGSAFLKNVYTVFQYPDYNSSHGNIWQPTVGLVPLTNLSVGSQDFYAVRSLNQPLSSVSANNWNPSSGTGGSTSSPASSNNMSAKAVATTGAIVGSVIGGVFVVAIAAFGLWWFWLRRKYGAGGVVEYRSAPSNRDRKGNGPAATVRTRKHEVAQRQKSMVEGYSDFEGDSWVSTTEGEESIRLGPMAEQHGDDRNSRPAERSSRGSSVRESSAKSIQQSATPLLEDEAEVAPVAELPYVDVPSPRGEMSPPPPAHNRQVSFSKGVFDTSLDSPPGSTPPKPYQPKSSARSLSMSMSGPFPSPMRSMSRHESSPYADIRSSDYFTIIPSGSVGAGSGGNGGSRGREGRTGSNGQWSGNMPRMQSPSGRVLGESVVEEPRELSPPSK